MNDMRYGWQAKIGLVAARVGATLVLRIPAIANPIRVLTVHHIRSYGEKWAGSAAAWPRHQGVRPRIPHRQGPRRWRWARGAALQAQLHAAVRG